MDEGVSRDSRILIASLTFGGIALIAATGVYYLRQRNAMEAAATQQLAAVADVKVQQIANWRRERLGDGHALQAAGLMRIARRALTTPGIEPIVRSDLLDVMQKVEREFLYTGVALVDRNGNIRLESKVRPSDLARVAELGKAASYLSDVALQDLYWDAKLNRPLMALLVPIQGAGAFVLTIDPDRFLYPFIRWWPGPSRSAETILFRIDGDRAVFLNDVRFKAGAALHYWARLGNVPRPDDLLKSRSVSDGPDYRGISVLQVLQKVPDSPWFLSAKIDRSEVDAPVSRLEWELASIIGLIALANAGGVAFIWRDQQIRSYRQREEWGRQLADETPAFLWTTSSDATDMFINKPLAEFIGGSQQQKLRGTWKAYLHPDDAERVSNNFYACVAAASEFTDEHRLRRSDGEYRWLIARGRPRFSHRGEYLGHAGALLDITERRIAEQSARENSELVRGQNRILQLVAKNTPLFEILNELVRVVEALSPDTLASILLLDPDGLRLRHGAAPSLPKSYIDRIDGEPIGPSAGSCGTAAFRHEAVIVEDIATDPLWEKYRESALQHGLHACWSTPIFGETHAHGPDLLGTFALYFRSTGRPNAWHRKLVEMAMQVAAIAILKARESAALKRREAQLVEAQHMARIGSYEWDLAAGKVYRSAELFEIFGAPPGEAELSISPSEAGAMLEEYLTSVHPDDRSHAKEVLDESFREHTPFEREERYICADGSVRVLRSQGKWLRENGGPVKLIGTCQDITERKLAERQLEAANAALAEELAERARAEKEIQALSARLINAQEEERSRLARELHDDLNQQIAALSVALSNLKRAIPSELAEPRSQSERIREKLYRLGESTRRLSHDLHPAILQFSGLDAALRAYCSELATLSNIQIAFRPNGSCAGLPAPIALCVYRIAQEALGNVVKHARTNRAEVGLTRSDNSVKLTVSDRGIGMNLDRRGAAPGLGLTSMRERARLVNGTINIQSKPGSGTTLTLNVPITAQASEVLSLETAMFPRT